MIRSIAHIFSLLLIFVLSSCDLRDLYIESETPVKVIVNMDWTELGSLPEGASIYFYPEGGGAPYVFRTNSVVRTEVSVPAGYYTVMVFNRTVNEFGSMSFSGMEALGTAGVTLLDKRVSWLDNVADNVPRIVQEPERIVVGRTDHFLVHSLTDRLTVQKYQSRGTSFDERDVVCDSVDVYQRRMTYTTYTTVRVRGIHNIKSVRAYIAGLADGGYLATRSAGTNLATYTMENWSINRDPGNYTTGYISTNFDCLGLPLQYLTSRLPGDVRIVIRYLLVDNKTVITHSVDVGDIIRQDDNAFLLELNLDLDDDGHALPDVEPEGGSASGFDVNINDWGDEEDIIVKT